MNAPKQKSLFFAYFCLAKQTQKPQNDRSGNIVREDPRRARRPVPRCGHAAIRSPADRTLALCPPRRGPAPHDRHRRRAPPAARRAIRPGAPRPGTRIRFRRRHEKIPLPDTARKLHRVGLHPRRRARHALRLLTGRVPHGLPLLRNRASGTPTVALRSRDPQSDRLPARTRPTHEPRVHGHGRTPRQHGQRPARPRNHHLRVGVRMVSDPHHPLHGRRRAPVAAVPRLIEGPPRR